MKKLFLAILLALGFVSVTSAQQKGDVEFGVNAGFNYSTVTTSYFQADTGFGFNFGVSADYYFSDRWSLKTKVIYDQKGWNNGFYEDETGFYPADYNLNYVTVPVMANWHFGGKRNWYLNFGPYAGFLMSAKENSNDTDVKDAFNSTDFGIAYGIGVKVPVSDKLKLFFEFEGQGGLTDIFKENEDAAVTNGRGSFNVGLNFLLK